MTTRIYVWNLHPDVDDDELYEFFLPIGRLSGVNVLMDSSGRSLCYGHVDYRIIEHAIRAIMYFDNAWMRGRYIRMGWSVNSQKNKSVHGFPSSDLYFRNLDPSWTEQVVRELFSEFGSVTGVLMSRDNDGISKGYGYISFFNPQQAKRAMEVMDGAPLGQKPLYVAWANEGSNVYIKHDDNDDVPQGPQHFSKCGTVKSAKLTNGGQGIIVDFTSPSEANSAITIKQGCILGGLDIYLDLKDNQVHRTTHGQALSRESVNSPLMS